MKFRKRPVVIEAFRFTPVFGKLGARASSAPRWFLEAEQRGSVRVWNDDETPYCMIETIEGSMKAEAGDWIICGLKGEMYPCKPDIFAATYDPVEAA